MDGCNGTIGEPGDPGYGIGAPGYPGPAVSTKFRSHCVTLCTSNIRFRGGGVNFHYT